MAQSLSPSKRFQAAAVVGDASKVGDDPSYADEEASVRVRVLHEDPSVDNARLETWPDRVEDADVLFGVNIQSLRGGRRSSTKSRAEMTCGNQLWP